jgi:lysyl-tRNA synthetase class 2
MSGWQDLKNNPRLRKIYNQRIEIIRLTREFFWHLGFLETDTPVAVALPGQEPYLSPAPVIFHEPDGAAHNFFLHTSPEFAMKKLLAAGYEKIFNITKCFRDYESFGGIHNPEFTMIEWYRAPGDYVKIMDDTEALFKFIGKKLRVKKLKYREKEIMLGGKWSRSSMKDVWRDFLGVNLDEYLNCSALAQLAKKLKLNVHKKYSYEDLFYLIFLNKIEPHLGAKKPIFIYDYPAQMCSLSRGAKDPRYAERFELYIGGLELANAFGELVDAEAQKKFLEEDQLKRKKVGREVFPVDPEFISALKSGIPEAGGIALGMDRMIMLFTGAKNINEVIFQSAADMVS